MGQTLLPQDCQKLHKRHYPDSQGKFPFIYAINKLKPKRLYNMMKSVSIYFS